MQGYDPVEAMREQIRIRDSHPDLVDLLFRLLDWFAFELDLWLERRDRKKREGSVEGRVSQLEVQKRTATEKD